MKQSISILMLLVSVESLAFDLVVNHGRVMDPASGLADIRHLGVEAGIITTISEQPLAVGKRTTVIDASGLVVAPGFIDIHAHGQDPVSNRFQAGDGVTTAMELEIGVFPVADWYAGRSGNAPLNFGATVSHPWARARAQGFGEDAVLTAGANSALTAAQHASMLTALRQGLAEGAIGIGMGIAYTPAADHQEILSVFRLAAEWQKPVFVHLRNAKFMNDDLLAPLQEVLSNAVVTGASLHVVHINSSLDTAAKTAVSMIRDLQAQGFDITTENYPYTSGSTRLESALFDEWDQYDRLQWVATGEFLTAKTFSEYRRKGGWVIIHGRSVVLNDWLVEQPDLIIASDGIPYVDNLSHPRSAGTFSKVLGHYVREKQSLTLMQALAKMTIMPARRLEKFAPALARKGRLAVGMDADITIFDPASVIDRATYTEPGQYSAGIVHVLVNGLAVVSNGVVMPDRYPGQPVKGIGGKPNEDQ